MLRAFGVGGPTVDTVLANPAVRPGEVLSGEVRIAGGDHPAEVEHVAVALATRVEIEHGDGESTRMLEFQRALVAGRTTIAPGQRLAVPFRLQVPLETPLTHVGGQPLHGMVLGLATELSVTGAVDPGDHDPVAVHPLLSQDRVLQAFSRLGFRFTRADNEHGRIHGVSQQLPFYQEIEFYPPPQFAGRISQVELTFVTDPHGLVVVLEADRRGGLLRASGDSFGHFRLTHDEAVAADWPAIIDQWVSQVAGRRGLF
jgi:sporulation-control protein